MARVRALFRRMQRSEADTAELQLRPDRMELATHMVTSTAAR